MESCDGYCGFLCGNASGFPLVLFSKGYASSTFPVVEEVSYVHTGDKDTEEQKDESLKNTAEQPTLQPVGYG